MVEQRKSSSKNKLNRGKEKENKNDENVSKSAHKTRWAQWEESERMVKKN